MTQENKDLLLKDLCARLPYGVKVLDDMGRTYRLNIGNAYLIDLLYGDTEYVEAPFKPYLRPMSSITEEEKNEFIHYAGYEVEESVNGRHYEYYLKDYVGTPEEPSCNCDAIDWLNVHHFDYRGLIEKGLAIEAPEGMYKKGE